jgi:hypothetical protein
MRKNLLICAEIIHQRKKFSKLRIFRQHDTLMPAWQEVALTEEAKEKTFLFLSGLCMIRTEVITYWYKDNCNIPIAKFYRGTEDFVLQIDGLEDISRIIGKTAREIVMKVILHKRK